MKLLYLFFIPLIFGCVKHETIMSIPIKNAFLDQKMIYLSGLSEQIEYVSLETLPQCVIGESLRVFADNELIIAIAFRQMYVFDRRTGKFIREIGRFGNHPFEYTITKHILPYSEKFRTLYCNNYNIRDLYEYDLDGNIRRTIFHPPNMAIANSVIMDYNLFVGYVENISGNAPFKLVLFSDKGDTLKTYPNKNRIISSDSFYSSSLNALFYRKGEDIYFFENCLDTIYKVSIESLTPYCRFDMDNFRPSYHRKKEIQKNYHELSKYFEITNIVESNRFITWGFWHQEKLDGIGGMPRSYFVGYYDKKENETFVSEIDVERHLGFINDIDDFVNIYPQRWSINSNEEFISFIEAGDIAEWFEENPEKAKKLPDHLKKLSKLTPEDNPVAVIIKLKK